MKKIIVLAAVAASFAGCNKSEETAAAGDLSMTTAHDSASYAIGMNIAESLKREQMNDINPKIIAQAIQDAFDGKEPLFDELTARGVFESYLNKAQEKAYESLKEDGEKFLAENAKKEGVNVTPSGLQYEIITLGTGVKPALESTVKVHYHGTLVDGTVFDSSLQRGEPASFPVNGVIQGWQEGIPLMPVGSKFKFYIPYNLAYGPEARGEVIKPYSTLIFEVELLEIVQ